MNFEQILARIEPIWQDDFRKLVTTGRASDAFWDIYEARPDYQALADQALQYFLEPFAESIRHHREHLQEH